MDYTLFQQLAVALALSSLVGLERERRYKVEGQHSFGGIRTFALIGLIGSLAYGFPTAIFGIFTAGFLALVLMGYWVTSKGGYGGATSEMAAVLVYMIGVFAAMGMFLEATAITLALMLILHFKDPLHNWAKHLRNEEIVSTIQFLIIAFVVLPLLPNESYGPYGFFNPYIVWLMVVFVSGISFLSYVAIKMFGAKRGIYLTGFLSGFISTTALAFSFSAQSRKSKIVRPFVAAMLIASTAKFVRVFIEVFVLNKELSNELIMPMAAMGITSGILFLMFFFKKDKIPKAAEVEMLALKSPFQLVPALKFGVLFAVILFISKFAMANLGDKGIYLASAVSGLVDVDAITVSMANLAHEGLNFKTAVIAISIATMVNSLSKGVIFILFGSKKVALRVFLAFLVIVAVGWVSLYFL